MNVSRNEGFVFSQKRGMSGVIIISLRQEKQAGGSATRLKHHGAIIVAGAHYKGEVARSP